MIFRVVEIKNDYVKLMPNNIKTKIEVKNVIVKDDIALMVFNLNKDHTISTLPLSVNTDIKIGDVFTMSKTDVKIKTVADKKALGRVFDFLGREIYNPLNKKKYKLEKEEVVFDFAPKTKVKYEVNKKLYRTGIKIIDFLFPITIGSKTGILGGAGVGKTILIQELLNNSKVFIEREKKELKAKKEETVKLPINIFTGIGERSREAKVLADELVELGLMDSTVMYYAQMEETSSTRSNIIFSSLTTAEFFVSKGHPVFMFVDNMYRQAQASAETSLSLGIRPSKKGYSPTLQSEMANIQSRIFSQNNNGITSIQTVFVPSDDFADPAVTSISGFQDTFLSLSRQKAARGLFPAIDVKQSYSKNIDINIIGERHFNLARQTIELFEEYARLKEIIDVVGIEQLSYEEKSSFYKAQKLENYFTQYFHVSKSITNNSGMYFQLEEILSDVDRIINKTEFDKIPAALFMFAKSLDEILINAKLSAANDELLTQEIDITETTEFNFAVSDEAAAKIQKSQAKIIAKIEKEIKRVK